MASVQFFTEKITFKIPQPRKTVKWLNSICSQEQKVLGELSYVFCSDSYLKRINQKYLRHSTLTDIISFPLTESSLIEGEIYISIPRVRDNARKFNEPFERELRRVMAHGILHFIGYPDKKASDKAVMRRKEEACLSLWDSST